MSAHGDLTTRSEEVYEVRTQHDTGHARPQRPRAVAAAVSLLGVALTLTGCAVGPKFERPDVTVNPTWNVSADSHVTTQAGPDSAWWRAFNDPALDRLVGLAYHQNLPLRTAGARIMEARAQMAVAVGRQYPQMQAVVGNATAVGLTDVAAKSTGLGKNFWDLGLGFDASWEIDFWRKYSRDVQYETSKYYATVADYDNSLVALTAEVARTYTLIRTYETLIDLAQRNVALQEEGLRIAQSRFRNGATSELDVTQATTLLESTRASIPRFESTLLQAQNALCTLLGQPTGTVNALLEGPRVIPTPPATVALSVPAELLHRRPDIRGREFAAAAASARIGIASTELYPRLAISGSIGTQAISGADAITSTTLFGPGTFFYSIGPRLLYPLLNYGRLKNNVRVEDARFQQSIEDYQQTVLKAAQEVQDGLAGFTKSQEAAVFSQNAATSARRSADLAFVQYREGAVDFQRVLDAQRSLLQEENSLAQTRSSIATNLVALYKALGGGWELRKGQPFVPESTQVEMKKRTNWGDLLSNPPSPETSNSSSNR
jgi:NodT family efflux transporter outer membrane factor (OMF) lipoprotein